MELVIPFFERTTLRIGNISGEGPDYPTSQLQKGLLLVHDGQNLAEEAIGFGVPVLKQSLLTIFAGDVELSFRQNPSFWQVTALFKMNLQEKIGKVKAGNFSNEILLAIKNQLAALHRDLPMARGFLTAASTLLRKTFGWETRYAPADFNEKVKVIYTIFPLEGKIDVEVRTPDLSVDNITEVVMMNEQGAHFFDSYLDSKGTKLAENEVGSWDEVKAETASFLCASCGLKFSVENVDGARLFRGQELIGFRLAWVGFGYSFSPKKRIFRYTLRLEKT